MEDKLPIEELLYEEEGTTLDFKRESYKFSSAKDHEKSEILKDILAFANARRRTDAYILIGVEEVKGGRSKVIGIHNELDDASLQQFVNSKTQRPIEFSYRTVLFEGVKIGVVRIPVQIRPFFLKKDYGNLKKHVIYIRRGSSTDEANPDEVFQMGQSANQESQDIPDLSFEFASIENRSSLGTNLDISLTLLDIPEIPDYYEETYTNHLLISAKPRPDYYRDLAKYYYVSKKSKKLAFLLKNDSSMAISDIKVELIVRKVDKKFIFFESKKFPELPQKHYNDVLLKNIRPLAKQFAEINKKTIEIQNLGDRYRIEVPFEKVQPKQTVFSTETVFIAANDSFAIVIDITVYADNIPVPIKKRLEISCNVTKREGSLEYIQELHHKSFPKKSS